MTTMSSRWPGRLWPDRRAVAASTFTGSPPIARITGLPRILAAVAARVARGWRGVPVGVVMSYGWRGAWRASCGVCGLSCTIRLDTPTAAAVNLDVPPVSTAMNNDCQGWRPSPCAPVAGWLRRCYGIVTVQPARRVQPMVGASWTGPRWRCPRNM